MKLVVIGGGGVRTPLLMPALVRRQETLDLQQVVLVDNDEAKLTTMAPLSQAAAEREGAEFELEATPQAGEALRGASAVITTIRPGGEEARVLDEHIALQHGVLGQETTGPGGFAMALRTIPAVAAYAKMMRELCPDAWLLNFTNPAGLVAQAITTEFPDLKVVGICDTPMGLQHAVARSVGKPAAEMPARFFGLNHLSWLAEALVDGENVIPRISRNPELIAAIPQLSLFDPELIALIGMLPNEYLYFYYYRDRALANIQNARETRGEQVRRLSAELLDDLRQIDPIANPEQARRRYQAYLDKRHGTYLATESGGKAEHEDDRSEDPEPEGEGYAGVALDVLTAAAGKPATLVANVPNRGAIPGMQDDDVVEVTCRCDQTGLHPVGLDDVPDDALLLMQAVKRYERLTVEAIRSCSREEAVEALMVHPLVGSYPVAASLVPAYLAAHEEYVGQWA